MRTMLKSSLIAIILSMLLFALGSPRISVSASSDKGMPQTAAAENIQVLRLAANALDPAKLQFHEVSSGLSQPLLITNAGDGSGRLFILERAGRIRVLKNGGLLSTPFLDIHTLIKSTGGEQGLLALAFHPDYATNGKFYTLYTNLDGNLVLSQFTRSMLNPDQGDPNSRVELLMINHPTYTNHNGGTLVFGPDGYLYWSTGDGGGAGDPNNNAQNLSSLLGKILRIDINSSFPYAIPPGNPFYANPNGSIRKEIWAFGLRNPWRISFDHLTNDLYIGDVGQSSREEIDFQPSSSMGGENYGWPVMEGSICYNDPSNGCDRTGKVLPVAEYDHSKGCSITGGHVYRGSSYPSLLGHYFYGDFCSGALFDLYRNAQNQWAASLILDTPYGISTFGEDEQGEMYLANYNDGRIYQIQYQELPGVPSNDNVGSPILITGVPYSHSQDTSLATPAPGDPDVPLCGLKKGDATVWYRYTPRSAQRLYLDTLGSSYDTFIAVWQGSPGSLLPVACNDDRDGSTAQSSVEVNLTAAVPYYIEVAQFNGTLAGGSKAVPGGSVLSGGSLQFHVTSFQDVPGDQVFWRYIEAFYRQGITSGCGLNPRIYCPLNNVTRAEMAVFALRARHGGSYVPPAATGIFSDVPVPGKEWMQPWIEQFYREGLTSGCGADPLRYCPSDNMTRAEAAVFLLRAKHGAGYVPPASTGIFADVPVTGKEWMQPWIEQFYREGITSGCNPNPLSYCPENSVTRQEMAVFISRAYGLAPLP